MLNLKKITTTVSLLSVGALSVALFSTGCDDGTTKGAGGAGGQTSTGGAGGQTSAGGAGGKASAGGAGGHSSAGGAGGHSSAGGAGGSATGGAAGGHGGTAAGGTGGTATGGAGGATGGHGGGALGGHGGSATGGSAGGAGGGSAGGAGGAHGDTIVYNVTLTGAMEVLPTGTTASTATGAATVTLNIATKLVSVQGSFTGLSSAATAAHIHGPAAAGAIADAIVVLTASAAQAGAVTGSGTLTPQQVTDMRNGMTYINVHSTNYGGGEIRGQIQ